jgi:hypothetical protein
LLKRLRAALVLEGKRLGAATEITGLQVQEAEASITQLFINRVVKMTADTRPHRFQAMLPGGNVRVGSEAMLNKQELSARLQYPAYLLQCASRFREAAESLRHNNRIVASVP